MAIRLRDLGGPDNPVSEHRELSWVGKHPSGRTSWSQARIGSRGRCRAATARAARGRVPRGGSVLAFRPSLRCAPLGSRNNRSPGVRSTLREPSWAAPSCWEASMRCRYLAAICCGGLLGLRDRKPIGSTASTRLGFFSVDCSTGSGALKRFECLAAGIWIGRDWRMPSVGTGCRALSRARASTVPGSIEFRSSSADSSKRTLKPPRFGTGSSRRSFSFFLPS